LTAIDETPIPFSRRIRDLAAAHPDQPALILVRPDGSEELTTWRDLDRDRKSTRLNSSHSH